MSPWTVEENCYNKSAPPHPPHTLHRGHSCALNLRFKICICYTTATTAQWWNHLGRLNIHRSAHCFLICWWHVREFCFQFYPIHRNSIVQELIQNSMLWTDDHRQLTFQVKKSKIHYPPFLDIGKEITGNGFGKRTSLYIAPFTFAESLKCFTTLCVHTRMAETGCPLLKRSSSHAHTLAHQWLCLWGQFGVQHLA